MADDLFSSVYNPDVLSCLANLSNDEVFTPPHVVNKMLDMLPQELFQNPNTTFLDPACKTGVFLREIAKRLITGLKPQIPDLKERIDHIFHKQLYGIAITELTSLLSRRGVYCSKYPNSEFSVTKFDDAEGNIRYRNIKHSWVNGKCKYCGTSKETVLGGSERGQTLESHAYEWIHTLKPEEIFNMKFDVIISNPPYQLSDGGAGASARPIYNIFVEKAIKLNPRFITMIIPSRWFAGGKGLDDFRDLMINNKHMRVICDYLDAADCFPGVEIKGGINYFLWDKEYSGDCEVKTVKNNKIVSSANRPMKETDSDVFIRFNEAVEILHKVQQHREKSFSNCVSARQPFALTTTFVGKKTPFTGSVRIYERGGCSYISKEKIIRNREWLDQYKVLISKAYNAGDGFPHQVINKPFIADKESACTETYIVIGPFKDKIICSNVISYIQTKLFRFLVLLKKSSQNAAKGVYGFVPIQDFSKPWKDEELYAKYGITDEEITFIDSMIRPMDLTGGNTDAD